ncbi:transposase [Enterococcus faecium]
MVSLNNKLTSLQKNKRYIGNHYLSIYSKKVLRCSKLFDLIEKCTVITAILQTITNMTKVLTKEVNAFKSRALNDKYVAIFMDATYIPLKRQTVSKEAIYIAIGIREDGTKEVLGVMRLLQLNQHTFLMSCYRIL